MKNLITIIFCFLSIAGFSQARELIARDTTNHRPGLIIYDTSKILNIDTTLRVISQNSYQTTLGVNPNVLTVGSYWANHVTYTQKIHNTNLSGVGIGTDTPFTKLHLASAIAANTVYANINDTTGFMISNTNAATAANQMYSPTFTLKGYGWITGSGGLSKPSLIRTYVTPIQGATWPLVTQKWEAGNSDGTWSNLMNLQAQGLGGGTLNAGLTVGNSANGFINVNVTTNQIDNGATSGALTISNTNGNGGVKLVGGTNIYVCRAAFNTFLATTNMSINDVSSIAVADSSAILDVTTTSKGFLMPRAKTTLIDSAASNVMTVSITTAGSGQTNGTYNTTTVTGGTGTGVKINFTVAGGVVTVATVTAAAHGYNYTVGDVLTFSALGGVGSGGTVTVTRAGFYKMAKGMQIFDTTVNQVQTFTGNYNSRAGRVTVSAAATLTLDYGDDYIFTGTTATYTLPAILANTAGRQNGIKIKNRGSGTITLNSNAGSTIYSSSAVGTLAIPAGSEIELMPDGTYFTVTVNSAGQILSGSATLDFGSTLAGTVTDLTITVTGAADGDVVSVGVPNGSYPATGTFDAWVSATNTVTVRFANNSLTLTQDPGSGTFKVKVFKD